MRYLIFSDVHANLPGLLRVLQFQKENPADALIHLGDIIGYNSYPNECIELFQKHDVFSIEGNHEGLLLGDIPYSTCGSDIAPHTLRVTGRLLPEAHRDYLRGLALQHSLAEGVELVHGSFRSLYETISTEEKARRNFEIMLKQEKRIAFYGHTHRPRVFCADRGLQKIELLRPTDSIKLKKEMLYLINPGTVGEPRHGEPCSFLSYDEAHGELTYQYFTFTEAEKAQIQAHNQAVFGNLDRARLKGRIALFGRRLGKLAGRISGVSRG